MTPRSGGYAGIPDVALRAHPGYGSLTNDVIPRAFEYFRPHPGEVAQRPSRRMEARTRDALYEVPRGACVAGPLGAHSCTISPRPPFALRVLRVAGRTSRFACSDPGNLLLF